MATRAISNASVPGHMITARNMFLDGTPPADIMSFLRDSAHKGASTDEVEVMLKSARKMADNVLMRLSALERDYNDVKAENAALRAENEALRAENAALKADNEALRAELAEVRAELTAIRAERDEERSKLERIRRALQNAGCAGLRQDLMIMRIHAAVYMFGTDPKYEC